MAVMISDQIELLRAQTAEGLIDRLEEWRRKSTDRVVKTISVARDDSYYETVPWILTIHYVQSNSNES